MRSPSEAVLINLFSACVWSLQFLQESRKPELQSHLRLQPIQKWDWYCICTATPSSSTLYNSQTLSTLSFHPSDSIWQARFGIPWYFENAQLTSRAGYSQYSSGLLSFLASIPRAACFLKTHKMTVRLSTSHGKVPVKLGLQWRSDPRIAIDSVL